MKKLLDTIFEDACSENVAGLFLQAANPDLASYYRKLGFDDFFFREHSFYYHHNFNHDLNYPALLAPLQNLKGIWDNPQTSYRKPLTAYRIPHTVYRKKRIQKFRNHCYVNWNEDFFHFLYEVGTQFCEYEDTIFSFKTSFNNIIIDELLGDAPHEQIAQLLFNELPDFDVVHIRSPHEPQTTHRIPLTAFCCGQVKWCNLLESKPNQGWFAFAME
jgi:hypothetical protein